ncbi:MAG TPA: ABC transporter ATP-binding protein [Sedimentisphaerales bacterium]|nr:ABC transporter ATP-binding protein [Sedimentisphaerales bacterium]
MSEKKEILLSVKGLSTHFYTERGIAKAVQQVSFSISRGKTFALVGESGCGKSVTALSVMRLVPYPPGRIVSGQVIFRGQDLLSLSGKRMRQIRGDRIAMIFQEPMTSLNPVFTVGDQIMEVLKLHQKKSAKQARFDAIDVLNKVGIDAPAQRVDEYPHQMSGGMRQRVMIAMAVSCVPDLLIADEPTTALDVTIQAQILDLLDDLQKQNNMSILLITHDLGVVAERADDVAVMYASRVVETSNAKTLFAEPLHPYTQGLLKSLPSLGFQGKRLNTIPGSVANPLDFPTGCKFHPRCPLGVSDKRCQTQEPQLKEVSPGRCVACWKAPGYEVQK